MKAVVQEQYGPAVEALTIRDIAEPAAGDGEVLVHVHAASLHAGDWLMMMGRPLVFRAIFGIRKPRKTIPGFDIAGTVEYVGAGVTGFSPGDEVFGMSGGACAEYVAASPDRLAPIPSNLSLRQSAPISVSGVTALRAIRDKAKVQPGHKVLINGASGGVGTYAVQIAKAYGAKVTGVCSTGKIDLVRSIGADHVIDYTSEDFTAGDIRYDVILDNAASHPLKDMRRVLTPAGTLIPNNGTGGGRWFGPLGRMVGAVATSLFVRGQGRPFEAHEKREDLLALKELIETGEVTPVIDRAFPLVETAAAMERLGSGRARGKIVIEI